MLKTSTSFLIEHHVVNRQYFYNGPFLWNNLQTSIKNSKTVRQFKRLYKQFLIDVINAQYDV